MAAYRVLQDIEAEDKLLGPLSLRQFIYAVIALVSAYLCYVLFLANPFLILIPLPIVLFFGLLASPFFGGQQSSEVYLLAIIRFILKPRRRVWDQAGLKELVTITAPKKEHKQLTKNHSQEEVQSRLSALAGTLDSRGWVIKNVQENLSLQVPAYNQPLASDRLVDPSTYAQGYDVDEAYEEPDMFDSGDSKIAQNFDQMIQSSNQTRRDRIVSQMQNPSNDDDSNWFISSTQQGQSANQQNDISKEEEQKLLKKVHEEEEKQHKANAHLKTLKPLSGKQPPKKQSQHKKETLSKEDKPGISAAAANYAHRNDLTVDTIARQREKETSTKDLENDGEVVVSLH